MPWRARPDLCGGRWETSVPTAMCARLTLAWTAGASPAERKGVTSHFCREPCVGSREGMGEASVAERVGRANERRNS